MNPHPNGHPFRTVFWVAVVVTVLPGASFAADADRGRDIARQTCVPCHAIAPGLRNEVADAPPFDVIGRKNGFDTAMLAYSLLSPHPRMNLALTQNEAADIAAYIGTLAK